MSDIEPATDETPRASEAEALASLREFALGPISAVFTWSEAATVLDLIEMLTKSGIIEVAIRNPSVAEYMAHWEGRAEKAEAVIEAQSKALAEARVAGIIECEAWQPGERENAPYRYVSDILRDLPPGTLISPKDVHTEGPRKKLLNAFTYAARTGVLERLGYGRYRRLP